MAELETHRKFEQVARKVDPGSTLLRAWDLKGGVSAQVTALEIRRPDGQAQKVIVRRHGAADLRSNPQIAADECKLLRITRAAGLATPAPLYVDQSGEIFADPYLVIEYIEGQTEFTLDRSPDFIPQCAAQLARIHALDSSNVDLSFLPRQAQRYAGKVRQRPAALDESIGEGRIRDVLESAGPLPQRNPSVLLHGDFWPGNMLWKEGQLVGVIDWEDAAVGDPLADLANSRLEILWAFGLDSMQSFTQRYLSSAAIDVSNLPFWDLFAALRPALKLSEWAGDTAAEQQMRERHSLFVALALETLGVS